jgi:arginyl-tRNA synthetase
MDKSLNTHVIIGEALRLAAKSLFGEVLAENQIQFQKTRKEFEGDITLVVFPLVKISKKSPEQTGELIGAYLKEHVAEIAAFNVVKGFLNISLSENFWLRFFEYAIADESFGFQTPNSKPRVMVEYSSPNTNKPLHLGHLRNNFFRLFCC